MAYATAADLAARWRPLGESETARAEALLGDASAYLDSVVERYSIDAVGKADALRAVCCDLVQRKMEQPSAAPLSSVQMQAGGFMQTMSYAQSARKFRLYPEDLEFLGVTRGGAACLYPFGGGGAS